MSLVVEFCGERHPVHAGRTFHLGRDGDVVLDDNPYLHRRFLAISAEGGIWWLANVGTLLSATVADSAGLMQAYLSPGGRLPLVFPRTTVLFTAGPTTYELTVVDEGAAAFTPVAGDAGDGGTTTIGRVTLTVNQRLLVLALAEGVLRGNGQGSAIPSSADAAQRLGWPLTTFNRKLDNVCEKLTRAGVRGLHSQGRGRAVNRRARLVEYAVASRLVTVEDLVLLGR